MTVNYIYSLKAGSLALSSVIVRQVTYSQDHKLTSDCTGELCDSSKWLINERELSVLAWQWMGLCVTHNIYHPSVSYTYLTVKGSQQAGARVGREVEYTMDRSPVIHLYGQFRVSNEPERKPQAPWENPHKHRENIKTSTQGSSQS